MPRVMRRLSSLDERRLGRGVDEPVARGARAAWRQMSPDRRAEVVARFRGGVPPTGRDEALVLHDLYELRLAQTRRRIGVIAIFVALAFIPFVVAAVVTGSVAFVIAPVLPVVVVPALAVAVRVVAIRRRRDAAAAWLDDRDEAETR